MRIVGARSTAAVWIARTFLVFLLVVAGVAILKKHVSSTPLGELRVSSDVLAYVSAAENMLHGENIYLRPDGQSNSYVYLPFLAFACIPLTLLPPIVVDVLWFVLNVCLVGVVMRFSYVLFTGSSFSSLPRAQQWFLGSATIILTLRYLVRNAQDANINVVILALIVLSLYFLRTAKRKPWAVVIGVVGAVKILPLIFTVYFVAKRQWRETLYVLVGFVVATLLPALILGGETWWESLDFFVGYTRAQFSPQGLEIENFSVWGFLGRVFSHNKAFEGGDGAAIYVNMVDLPLPVLRAAIYAMDVGLVVLVYLFSKRDEDTDRTGEGKLMNGGMILTLLAMNLASILTEDHHTVAFMVAYLFLLVAWREKLVRHWWFAVSLVASGLLSIGLSYDVIVPLLGKYTYNLMLSYSLPVLPVGITLLVLVVYVMQRDPARA